MLSMAPTLSRGAAQAWLRNTMVVRVIAVVVLMVCIHMSTRLPVFTRVHRSLYAQMTLHESLMQCSDFARIHQKLLRAWKLLKLWTSQMVTKG